MMPSSSTTRLRRRAGCVSGGGHASAQVLRSWRPETSLRRLPVWPSVVLCWTPRALWIPPTIQAMPNGAPWLAFVEGSRRTSSWWWRMALWSTAQWRWSRSLWRRACLKPPERSWGKMCSCSVARSPLLPSGCPQLNSRRSWSSTSSKRSRNFRAAPSLLRRAWAKPQLDPYDPRRMCSSSSLVSTCSPDEVAGTTQLARH
mmetsp:Transcript_64165/g.165178  ORF Transcript_64165/g.165178 Transcript_64165/m.165178 type:complete len:201 (+) Transcript_64165:1604-2206(+)